MHHVLLITEDKSYKCDASTPPELEVKWVVV